MVFKKKNCRKCGSNVADKYEYCPYCGNSLNKKRKKENFGMLGADDNFGVSEDFNDIKFPAGFNMLLNSLLKNLEKQFRNMEEDISSEEEDNKKMRKGGIRINISTFGDSPKVKMNSLGKGNKRKQKRKRAPSLTNLSPDKFKKFAKVPKKEPETNVRRLSDKVVYEINMPGIKSLNDISIMNLESSVEIKAISNNKAYSKIISAGGLPLSDYKFYKGKLVLEFDVS